MRSTFGHCTHGSAPGPRESSKRAAFWEQDWKQRVLCRSAVVAASGCFPKENWQEKSS